MPTLVVRMLRRPKNPGRIAAGITKTRKTESTKQARPQEPRGDAGTIAPSFFLLSRFRSFVLS